MCIATACASAARSSARAQGTSDSHRCLYHLTEEGRPRVQHLQRREDAAYVAHYLDWRRDGLHQWEGKRPRFVADDDRDRAVVIRVEVSPVSTGRPMQPRVKYAARPPPKSRTRKLLMPATISRSSPPRVPQDQQANTATSSTIASLAASR